MMYLFSYNPHSNGAKQLAKELGIKTIRHNRSKFKGGPNKCVINWGASELPAEVAKCRVINSPEAVLSATNKLSFFKDLAEKVSIPPFTENIEEAKKWIRDGDVVLCRTVLNGSGGKGIVIAESEVELVPARLYTKYVKKKDEYRVHVGKIDGNVEVFDIQQKARKMEAEAVDWRIRNIENGFIYKRFDIEPPDHVLDNAKKVLQTIPLDFGAVDIIYNAHENTSYVLEINTAPGLEGQTVKHYKDFLEKFM